MWVGLNLALIWWTKMLYTMCIIIIQALHRVQSLFERCEHLPVFRLLRIVPFPPSFPFPSSALSFGVQLLGIHLVFFFSFQCSISMYVSTVNENENENPNANLCHMRQVNGNFNSYIILMTHGSWGIQCTCENIRMAYAYRCSLQNSNTYSPFGIYHSVRF